MGDQGSSGLGRKVLQFAKSKMGKQVGTGECYDLAEEALKAAGAKSAPDYGEITKTADYKWGREVSLLAAQPGDVLQFRDHRVETITKKKIKVVFPDNRWVEYEETKTRNQKRGHHTAVVSGVQPQKGRMVVLEQHVMRGRTVVDKTVGRGTIHFKDSVSKEKSQESLVINRSWGEQMKKRFYKGTEDRKFIDDLVKRHGGKQVKAMVETARTIRSHGKIWVYRAEPEK